MNKSARVMTNVEGSDSNITLQIKGEVWQAIEVTPRTVAFGRVVPEQSSAASMVRKVSIVNNVEGELKLGEPQSTNASFKASIAPVKEGKRYEMTVELVQPLKSGNAAGKITIATGVPELPTIDIPVYANVVASIEVSPLRVMLNTPRADVQTIHLYVRTNVAKPFKIGEMKAPVDDIKLTLTDIKDAQTYRVQVEVPAGYKPKAGDHIAIATDQPDVPSLTVPIVESTMSQTRTAVTPTPGGIRPTKPVQPPAAARPAQPASAAQTAKPAGDAKPAQETRAAAPTEEKAKPAGR